MQHGMGNLMEDMMEYLIRPEIGHSSNMTLLSKDKWSEVVDYMKECGCSLVIDGTHATVRLRRLEYLWCD